MSWLLVAFVPGLLMLATFGLGRLETGLDTDHRPRPRPEPRIDVPASRGATGHTPEQYLRLPAQLATSGAGNTQFPATRQPNRV